MPEEKVESINGLTLTADGKGAVFDVAAEHLDEFLSGIVLHISADDSMNMSHYNHSTVVV